MKISQFIKLLWKLFWVKKGDMENIPMRRICLFGDDHTGILFYSHQTQITVCEKCKDALLEDFNAK